MADRPLRPIRTEGASLRSRWSRFPRRRPAPLAAALIGAAALLVVFQFAALGLARRVHVLATPQRFSELYFTHAGRLPSAVAPDQLVDLGFTIVNHEGRRYTYHWLATMIEHGAAPVRLASGRTTVGPGRAAVVPLETLFPAPLTAPTVVYVRLDAPREVLSVHLKRV